jgi:nicotinamide mononucleotide transporter
VALSALNVFQTILSEAQRSSPLEWLSLLAGVCYALLAVRQSRWCWVFGALSSSILVFLAFDARLPMQAALQAYYVAMSIYGFWHWSRLTNSEGLPIGTWPPRWHVGVWLGIAAVTLTFAPAIGRFTQAAWPQLDTATMLASLLATWMVAASKLENWLYWIVIDAVSVFLYSAQGLWFIALLYAIYLVIAIAGFQVWRQRWRAQRILAQRPMARGR